MFQTQKAKWFFIMNKQDFNLHHYFAELQQEKQLVFFFKSRLEMQVSNEVYDSTFICTWNLTPLVFILHHYGNGPIVSGVETSSALFKTCFWKSFGYLQCLESLQLWGDLLKVNVMAATKINPLYQTCQAAFCSVSAQKRLSIIFFSFFSRAKDKPVTEQPQLKQSHRKWIFFPSYLTSARKPIKFSLFWSYLKAWQNCRL